MRLSVSTVLCCVLLTCCCSVAVGQIIMDCCLEVKNKVVQKNAFADYSVQVAGQGCAIDAMLLVTRERRTLCVPPNQHWVKDVVKHVDKLKKHCRKNNYQGRRCVGVRPQ